MLNSVFNEHQICSIFFEFHFKITVSSSGSVAIV